MAADILDPYGADLEALANKKRLAQLMIGQGMDMSPILSPWQGVARVAQSILGNMDMRDAERGAKDLAQRHVSDRQGEMSRIFEAAQGSDKMALAKLLAASSDPTFQQAGLGMVMKGPGKLDYHDAGDRIIVTDESGRTVREIPKNVTPDARFGKETVSADTVLTHGTPSAAALLTDNRTRQEGAANRAVQVHGQQMTDARSRDANTISQGNRNRDDVDGLRKEFEALPEVRNFKQVLPVVQSAARAPNTPAGDIDLIYAVGKIMDPNSVVREGELKLVIAAGSPAQKLQGLVNYVSGGGRLAPEQRADLMATLNSRVAALKQNYDVAQKSYEGIATSRGHDPKQIFQALPSIAEGGPKRVQSQADYDAVPSGATYVAPDGSVRTKR